MDIFLSIAILFSLLLGTLFVLYVIAVLIPFLRYRPHAPGEFRAFDWHFMIPCRDEETVIGETIDYLQTHFPHANIWVIDDDSDDATAQIVTAAAQRSPLVHLVQRRRPNARTGKAHALNFAWSLLRDRLPETADLDRTILVVVDADGRPSANMLDVCAAGHLFADPTVGAVQVEVRMSNRDHRTPFPGKSRLKNLLGRTFVRMQDIEFRGPISAIQMSRKYTRTVNVGGNGQLARMSALAGIAGAEGPWRGSLLEDFELGLHLLLGGWRNAYTPDAWVDQEALYSPTRFIIQRARWAQGTMQCFRYLPSIWSSPLNNLGALEISYFLMQPWLQLVGTILYPVPVAVMIYNFIVFPDIMHVWLLNGGSILLIMYLVIGVGEFLVWGPLYRIRSEPHVSVVTAVGWGISYLLYIYLIYVVAWKAFIQLVARRKNWAKTIRNAETVGAKQLVARLD